MVEQFTISRDDKIYEAFPDVELASDGTLVCVFLECTHHGDRSYTRNVIVTSEDQGRTWSKKRPLTDPLNVSEDGAFWDCPRVTRLDDGTLVAVVNRISGTLARRDETENLLLFSEDQGNSWSDLHETPVTGIVPDQLIELESGPNEERWILTTHTEDGAGVYNVNSWYSDDRGESWTGPVSVAREPDLDLCEASIVELPGGELVCFMRENSGEGLDAFKSISEDGGESWEGPYEMPIPACHRPVAGVLDNQEVLITHRFMQGGSGWLGSWTQNTFAALTDPEACLATERNEAWTRILPLDYDRSPDADTGYTGWTQFEDGKIYVVNYIVDDAPSTRVRKPSGYDGEYQTASKAYIKGYALERDDFLLE